MLQFILPARARGIDREEADSFISVAPGVLCNLLIRDPETGQGGFSTEDDGPIAFLGLRAILLPMHIEVESCAGDSLCLLDKVFGEMAGCAKEMRVNIDQHSITSRRT